MEWITDNIIALSQITRNHLDIIALALTSVTLVFTGSVIVNWGSNWLNRLPPLFRVPSRAVFNLALFGSVLVFVPTWFSHILGYFNDYTLAPILVVLVLSIGLLSEKPGR
jgi:hypothetical protein